MPTENEIRVMEMLSAIEVPEDAAEQIEALGADAVTVVCEAALGTYPGLRQKIRTNAAAVVGKMNQPQARETLALLINDPLPDIAVRALRAAARRGGTHLIDEIGKSLRRKTTDPHAVAEAILALRALDTPQARSALETYQRASAAETPHRASIIVQKVLDTRVR